MQFWDWCAAHKIELIIAAVAVAAVVLVIGIIVGVHKRKKKSTIGKIYLTTEGFLHNKKHPIKDRRVAPIVQRKKDGAVVVVKIFSKKGKEEKIGEIFIPDLVLNPEDHSSLTKDSIVGRRTIFGIKIGENEFLPLYVRDFEPTDDELTQRELRKVKKEVHNAQPKHRKTYRKKLRDWKNGFKNKKQ